MLHVEQSEKEYRASPEMNVSTLALIGISPLALKNRLDFLDENEGTKAMSFGTAIHACCLEPVKFTKQYVPFEGDLRSNAQKALWASIEAGGQTPIKEKDVDICYQISNALRAHPKSAAILNDPHAEFEKVLRWTDEDTGTKCKGRIDILSPTRMTDLKSTESTSYWRFKKSCQTYGYFAKLPWYRDGAILSEKLSPEGFQSTAIACTKSKRPSIAVYNFPTETVEAGRIIYKNWLRQYEFCLKNDYWPDVNDGQEVNMYMDDWMMQPKKIFLMEKGEAVVL